MKHLHHIKPKHRGGTDDDGVVEVSITCHAMFHWCEWKLHGHKEDYIAWKFLSGSHPGGWNEGHDRPEHSKRMSGEGNPMFGVRGKDHPSYGHTQTQEQKEANSARMKANNPAKRQEVRAKLSKAAKKQTNRAKSYNITLANGEVRHITNLAKWCRDNGYNKAGCRNLLTGAWKKYKDLVSIQPI